MRPVLATVTLACVVSSLHAQHLERFVFEREAMGTQIRIVVYATSSTLAKDATAAAFARIHRLEAVLSDYDPASELSRLTTFAGTGQWVAVSDDLWAVLATSQRLARATDGAFDITVGPLTRLWRWAQRRGVLPDTARIAAARSAVDYRLVVLDENGRRAKLERAGMRLDAGGIGKGYAADAALAVLRTAGIRQALVDAGGDIAVSDAPPGTLGWTIGVPALDGDSLGHRPIRIANGGVATSGDAYRYLDVGETRYSHILDPATGLGLTVRRVATVIAPDATQADALASALGVLGPTGLEALDGLAEVAGHVFEVRGGSWTSWSSPCSLPEHLRSACTTRSEAAGPSAAKLPH